MTAWVPRLREALTAAGYTYDTVAELLGPEAHAALGRNETTPARRRTGGGAPLATLVRLFLLQVPVAREAAEAALPELVAPLAAAGVLTVDGEEVAALVDARPYADDDHDWWVLSDLTPGLDGPPHRVSSDHVLGISGASTSLAQLTRRRSIGSALDLGTGCGVQALHLATHADRVVATDVNQRALWLARLNAELNEATQVEVREGSLFDPVAGERFDLIATNPPFVISPPGSEQLIYRDSGLPGDEVVERIVREAPAHLTEGGWLQVLGNWVVRRGRPWDARLAEWVPDDCSALVVQRELVDPAAYVELWLKDAGRHGDPDYSARYDAWLGWLEDQQVEAIGFGWITLRRARGTSTFLDWPYDVEQPIAPAIAAWAEATDLSAAIDDTALLAAHPVVAPDVRQETFGVPGEADPETIVLRQQRGLRRARTVDTVEAGFVGAADGDLSTAQLLGALATLLQRDAEELESTYLPVVRELIVEGFVTL